MDVKNNERLAAFVLADACDPDGVCIYGVTKLAKRGGMSVRSFQEATSKLERKGWVVKHLNAVRSITKNGKTIHLRPDHRPNQYVLQWDQGPAGPIRPSGREAVDDENDQAGRGAESSGNGVQNRVDDGVQNPAPNPPVPSVPPVNPPVPSSSSATSRARAAEPGDDDGTELIVEALELAGYPRPTPTTGEARYTAAATARGWTPHDILERATRASSAGDPRAYLLQCLRNLANTDPPARTGPPPSTRPETMSPPTVPQLGRHEGWDTPEVTRNGLAAARAALGIPPRKRDVA
jgi:hypothetical protein